eukprot:1315655-Amorphochlora_amoeboformis.AAC.2
MVLRLLLIFSFFHFGLSKLCMSRLHSKSSSFVNCARSRSRGCQDTRSHRNLPLWRRRTRDVRAQQQDERQAAKSQLIEYIIDTWNGTESSERAQRWLGKEEDLNSIMKSLENVNPTNDPWEVGVDEQEKRNDGIGISLAFSCQIDRLVFQVLMDIHVCGEIGGEAHDRNLAAGSHE